MRNKDKTEFAVKAAQAAQGNLPDGWFCMVVLLDFSGDPKMAQTHIVSPLEDADTIKALRHMADEMENDGHAE